MNSASTARDQIESAFRERVQGDGKVKNGYLLVHSERLGIDLDIAEGWTGEIPADREQAIHLASVGKLFTATLVSMLRDRGLLTFDAPIAEYLEADLMRGLHVYKGHDYSNEITVKHLLQQTSGLRDVFFPLLDQMMDDPHLDVTPTDAVAWGKAHLKPRARPGEKHIYTETNYFLLGFIVEHVTGKRFHEAVHEMVFRPLGMDGSYVNGYSRPKSEPRYPPAGMYVAGIDYIEDMRVAQIDYSSGGIVAPLRDYLAFMTALVEGRLVDPATLHRMIHDDVKMAFPAVGFEYGYSIWKPRAIPLLMSKDRFCWGCVGITGSFMFFHPLTQAYVIGTFNDDSYKTKALSFMFRKVIEPLLKTEPA